jgi:molybdenum cofactor synthesis domain-containing protein
MRLRVGVLTISDRAHQGVYEDKSGPLLGKEVEKQGWEAARLGIVPDLLEEIEAALVRWSDQKGLDIILTTGGTGLGPRDVTPEATRRVLDKELPGFGELMRTEGTKITPLAALSRALAGSRKESILVNLPGSPQGALESLRAIIHLLPHAVAMLHGAGHAGKEEGMKSGSAP